MSSSHDEMQKRSRIKKTVELEKLMLNINSNGGTNNCGYVALKLDDLLNSGAKCSLETVSTADANLYFDPKIDKDGNIFRSETHDKRIVLLN